MTVPSFLGYNHLVASLIIEELIRLGVRTFVLSPGSRSTPLAIALERHRERTVVHVDERGAAYFGYGVALSKGLPAALICTSGTALANYLPAVVEAAQSQVPLFIISADRPTDLLDTGANQTIRHRGIFSHYIRGDGEISAPDAGTNTSLVLRLVDELYARSRAPLPGPVHLNVAFRKPLLDSTVSVSLPAEQEAWFTSGEPWCVVDYGRVPTQEEKATVRAQGAAAPVHIPTLSQFSIESTALCRIEDRITTSTAGAILVSGFSPSTDTQPILDLAQHLQWPILADVTSQVRVGSKSSLVFAEASAVYELPRARELLSPDVILHLGTQPVSGALLELLATCPVVAHCSPTPSRSDVSGNTVASVTLSPEALLSHIRHRGIVSHPSRLNRPYRAIHEAIQDASSSISAAITDSELAAVEIILRDIPATWQLYLANSLPIRLVDSSLHQARHTLRIGYHRGASGIDGTIAAATGFAHAANAPTIALIGDLAAFHDCTSLVLAQRSPIPVICVVINNGGGGIFATLPHITEQPCFTDYFLTPQPIDFSGAAQFSGLPYQRVEHLEQLSPTLGNAITSGVSAFIEISVEGSRTLPAIEARRKLLSDILTSIDGKGLLR